MNQNILLAGEFDDSPIKLKKRFPSKREAKNQFALIKGSGTDCKIKGAVVTVCTLEAYQVVTTMISLCGWEVA